MGKEDKQYYTEFSLGFHFGLMSKIYILFYLKFSKKVMYINTLFMLDYMVYNIQYTKKGGVIDGVLSID